MTAPANRCRDDLFARSRRAPLSAVEQRALDAHLAVCDLCRAARAFALLYDAIPDGESAGDDRLIARLADRVAGGAAASRPRRRARVLAAAAGIALLVAAGGAAAWVSVRGFVSPARSPDARAEARAERRRPRAAPRVAPALDSLGEALDETADETTETTDRAGASGRMPLEQKAAPSQTAVIRRRDGAERGKSPRTSLAKAAPTPAPTAAALFAEANAARRAFDLHRATDLYLTLDRRFPESGEAAVALVSAGDLLSRRGEPAASLQAFDRYLDRQPGGALAPEALFGRARALQQLGRHQDEIDAWRRLLRTVPGSVYESAGRQRLGELLR